MRFIRFQAASIALAQYHAYSYTSTQKGSLKAVFHFQAAAKQFKIATLNKNNTPLRKPKMIEKIADYLYVSDQLKDERFAKRAASYGIKTVICNRPDGEAPDQPSFEQVKAWLNANGIEHVIYMPVVMDGITDETLDHFQTTVANSEAPIMAFCRTGTRSSMLWALNQARRGVEVNSLIKAASLANIDLEPQRHRLEAIYTKKG